LFYNIDFKSITGKAYCALYSLESAGLPIDPVSCRILDEGLIVISYQRYAEISGVATEELMCGDELKDGFSVLRARGKCIILYDDSAYAPRKRFTVSHEIGHYILEHSSHGDKEEIEANFFASQFLAPTALFNEIRNRGHFVSYERIIGLMELSREAQDKKLAYLEKYGNDISHSTIYDDYVHEKFKSYLDTHFPVKKDSLRWIWNENGRKV